MAHMKNLPGIEGKNYETVYGSLNAEGLVQRLIKMRPIVFFKGTDHFVLRSTPLTCRPGGKKWHNVANIPNKKQNDHPFLCGYISYDEMLLSALVNMSTPTFYVSDGSQKNPIALPTRPFIPEGVLCGIVGARLTKRGFMENRFVFPRNENDKSFFDVHHSDQFWVEKVFPEAFPEKKIPTEKEIRMKPSLYGQIYKDGINVVYFKKRLAMTVVPFLKEAERRGVEKERQVVASVPGIGSGVWRGSVDSRVIVDLIVTVILEYFDNDFDVTNLSYLVALYPPETNLKVYQSFKPSKQISSISIDELHSTVTVAFKGQSEVLTIYNRPRFVAQILPEKFKHCLSVAAYAWDGNSYPGNNYWVDSFSSFDPQAILCSCLGQFQNPEVNQGLADGHRIRLY